MSALSITVTGDAQVLALLDRMEAGLRGPALGTALGSGALIVVNAAKANVGKRSGNLARDIHASAPEQAGNVVRVRVGTSVIYGRIQEYGGTITAKNGPFLVFQTEDGHWVRVKSVTLPARPYLRPALDANRAAVVAEVRQVLMAQLRGA